MSVWVVGWAQDLDDWGLHGVFWSREAADEHAYRVATERHYDAWRLGPRYVIEEHEWYGWECCRPKVIRAEVS